MFSRPEDPPGAGAPPRGSSNTGPDRPLASLLARLAETLISTVPLDSLSICMADPSGRTLSCHTLFAEEDHETITGPHRMRVQGSAVGQVIRTGEGRVYSSPLPAHLAGLVRGVRAQSLMLVPVRRAGATLAVLVLVRGEGEYGQAHMEASTRLAMALARELESVIASVS